MTTYTYLAIPYSGMEHESYAHSLNAVSVYLKNGVPAYSPIVHQHVVAEQFDLPKDYAFWRAADEAMIATCGAFHVLVPPGWEKYVRASKGVRMELRHAHGIGKHCHAVRLDGDDSGIHKDEEDLLYALLYG